MEQSIPGSQNEPFFELLHPNAPLPPHPAPSASQNGSVSADPPPTDSFDLGAEKIEPSFDFQPIRSNSASKVVDVGTRPEEISCSKGRPSSASDNCCEPKIFQFSEPVRTWDPANKSKEERDSNDSVAVAAVERTMKKYADNLLRVLEVMSGRLSKLEATSQELEHAVEGLKIAEGENHVQTSGRIVRLEELIKEVCIGVQLLHERQEIAGAKSELMKPQHVDDKVTVSGVMKQTPNVDGWQQPKGEVIGHHLMSTQPSQQIAYHPQAPPSQQPSHHPQVPPPLPPPPMPHAHPAAQLLSPPISVNVPNEPANPTIQQPLSPPQQQHLPPPHPAQAPPQSMQMSSFYSQQPPQHQGSLNQQVEPTPYGVQPHAHHPIPANPPSSSYLSELPQYNPGNYEGPRTLSAPQQSVSSHQHGPGAPSGHQQMFEPVIGRMGSTPTNLPLPYVQQPQSSPPVSMYETYGSAPYRVAQPVPSAPSGGSGYPRLPTAQPLQHALPAISGSSTGVPHSTNRVPIDEVIDKVASMGFSREQVKTVVRRLSENGQSVDLNIVLDKLMNGGGEFQAPKGWFSR